MTPEREAEARALLEAWNGCPYCDGQACGIHGPDPCNCEVVERHTGIVCAWLATEERDDAL